MQPGGWWGTIEPIMKKLEYHPLADLFPMMSDAELRELADDIAENGQEESIKLYEGMVLDGRNRHKACNLAGVEPHTEPFKGKDATKFVLSKNLKRRHLTDSQRAMVAANLANLKHGQKKSDRSTDLSQSESAGKLSVSVESVKRAKQVIESGSASLIKAVEAGEVSVRSASVVAQLPKSEQRAVVRAGPDAVKKAASEIRSPGLCQKCTRLGKTKDCPQCSAMKETKNSAGQPKSESYVGKLKTTTSSTLPEVPGVYTPRITKTSAGDTILDAYDNPIPSAVADSFMDGRLREILILVRSAAEDFDDAYVRLAKLKSKGDAALHYPWLELHTVKDEVEKARNAAVVATDIMRNSMPHAVCPDCHGATTGCKSCRMASYWPKQQCIDQPSRFRKESR